RGLPLRVVSAEGGAGPLAGASAGVVPSRYPSGSTIAVALLVAATALLLLGATRNVIAGVCGGALSGAALAWFVPGAGAGALTGLMQRVYSPPPAPPRRTRRTPPSSSGRSPCSTGPRLAPEALALVRGGQQVRVAGTPRTAPRYSRYSL